MAASTETNASPALPIQVSMPEVVKFVRQLAHDLRNHLNAAELQSAYLAEVAENNESREEIKRLRSMIGQVGTTLQELTAALSQPRLTQMPYPAAEFLEDLRAKFESTHAVHIGDVTWQANPADATLDIDPQLLLPALLELFANAFRHGRGEGPILVSSTTDKGRFVFELSEPKKTFERSTENWGREPFGVVGQGHYGLGLHRVRAVVEAHGGEFSARYEKDAGTLVSRVALPAKPLP